MSERFRALRKGWHCRVQGLGFTRPLASNPKLYRKDIHSPFPPKPLNPKLVQPAPINESLNPQSPKPYSQKHGEVLHDSRRGQSFFEPGNLEAREVYIGFMV